VYTCTHPIVPVVMTCILQIFEQLNTCTHIMYVLHMWYMYTYYGQYDASYCSYIWYICTEHVTLCITNTKTYFIIITCSTHQLFGISRADVINVIGFLKIRSVFFSYDSNMIVIQYRYCTVQYILLIPSMVTTDKIEGVLYQR